MHLVSDQNASELRQPRDGAFDNPTPRRIPLRVWRIRRLSGTLASVTDVFVVAHCGLARWVVVASVQAQMLRVVHGGGSAHHDGVQSCIQNFVSCTFAPAITMPRGLPVLSTSRLHFTPFFAVGGVLADRVGSHLRLAARLHH